MTSVAFQSILRKQIRKLPKILKSVKIIHYYSLLLIRVLRRGADPALPAVRARHVAPQARGRVAPLGGLLFFVHLL